MKKIPTIYQRDPATKLRYVMNERHPDCGWVFDGEGTPTYKWDGTAVLVDNDHPFHWLWKRREVKPDKPTPAEFRQVGEADPNTGKRVGWVPADPTDPSDQWLMDALDDDIVYDDGTYELVGPKVQGNPHGLDAHELIPHGGIVGEVPTEFHELGRWLHHIREGQALIEDEDGAPYPDGFEGIVWHHPDGRMAKIKAKDFPA